MDALRLRTWNEIQARIASCRECCARGPGTVTRPLQVGEIPDPPDSVDILFVGVAPTSEEGPTKGGHFYSSEKDLLRVGLFRVLGALGFQLRDVSLDEGNRRFHEAGLFFVHCAKVRPVRDPAPPPECIRFCVGRHLRDEIVFLRPRALCFLGLGNASIAAMELFARSIGEEPISVGLDGWSGLAAVAPQPRRGWEKGTKEVVSGVWTRVKSAG